MVVLGEFRVGSLGMLQGFHKPSALKSENFPACRLIAHVVDAGGMLLRPDVDDLDGWLWLSETALVPSGDHKEVKDCVGADGYVLINQEDIVDSIASFMACYISSIPQAKVYLHRTQ